MITRGLMCWIICEGVHIGENLQGPLLPCSDGEIALSQNLCWISSGSLITFHLWLCIFCLVWICFFFSFQSIKLFFVINWRFLSLCKYFSLASCVTSGRYTFHHLHFSNPDKMWTLGLRTVFQHLTRRLPVPPPQSLPCS